MNYIISKTKTICFAKENDSNKKKAKATLMLTLYVQSLPDHKYVQNVLYLIPLDLLS